MQQTMNVGATDTLEFPFLAELPKREKGRVAKLWDLLEEVGRIQRERGPIIPQAVAADALGISRARVAVLVDEARLESIMIGEHRFVLLSSVKERAQMEKSKGGRPRKDGIVEGFKAGIRAGKAMADADDRLK